MSTMSTHSSAILNSLDGHGITITSSLVKKTTFLQESWRRRAVIIKVEIHEMAGNQNITRSGFTGHLELWKHGIWLSNYNTQHVYMASNGKSSPGFIDQLIHSEKYKSPHFLLVLNQTRQNWRCCNSGPCLWAAGIDCKAQPSKS